MIAEKRPVCVPHGHAAVSKRSRKVLEAARKVAALDMRKSRRESAKCRSAAAAEVLPLPAEGSGDAPNGTVVEAATEGEASAGAPCAARSCDGGVGGSEQVGTPCPGLGGVSGPEQVGTPCPGLGGVSGSEQVGTPSPRVDGVAAGKKSPSHNLPAMVARSSGGLSSFVQSQTGGALKVPSEHSSQSKSAAAQQRREYERKVLEYERRAFGRYKSPSPTSSAMRQQNLEYYVSRDQRFPVRKDPDGASQAIPAKAAQGPPVAGKRPSRTADGSQEAGKGKLRPPFAVPDDVDRSHRTTTGLRMRRDHKDPFESVRAADHALEDAWNKMSAEREKERTAAKRRGRTLHRRQPLRHGGRAAAGGRSALSLPIAPPAGDAATESSGPTAPHETLAVGSSSGGQNEVIDLGRDDIFLSAPDDPNSRQPDESTDGDNQLPAFRDLGFDSPTAPAAASGPPSFETELSLAPSPNSALEQLLSGTATALLDRQPTQSQVNAQGSQVSLATTSANKVSLASYSHPTQHPTAQAFMFEPSPAAEDSSVQQAPERAPCTFWPPPAAQDQQPLEPLFAKLGYCNRPNVTKYSSPLRRSASNPSPTHSRCGQSPSLHQPSESQSCGEPCLFREESTEPSGKTHVLHPVSGVTGVPQIERPNQTANFVQTGSSLSPADPIDAAGSRPVLSAENSGLSDICKELALFREMVAEAAGFWQARAQQTAVPRTTRPRVRKVIIQRETPRSPRRDIAPHATMCFDAAVQVTEGNPDNDKNISDEIAVGQAGRVPDYGPPHLIAAAENCVIECHPKRSKLAAATTGSTRTCRHDATVAADFDAAFHEKAATNAPSSPKIGDASAGYSQPVAGIAKELEVAKPKDVASTVDDLKRDSDGRYRITCEEMDVRPRQPSSAEEARQASELNATAVKTTVGKRADDLDELVPDYGTASFTLDALMEISKLIADAADSLLEDIISECVPEIGKALDEFVERMVEAEFLPAPAVAHTARVSCGGAVWPDRASRAEKGCA